MTIKSMRWLFSSLTAAVVIPALYMGTQPATAGLGDADTEVVKEFDAWCGKKKITAKLRSHQAANFELMIKMG